MITREPIYSALFALWQNLPGVITWSRRLEHWSDVPPSKQPALYQIQRHEDPKTVRGIPTTWHLSVDLYIYVNSGLDPDAVPSLILNPILDAIETALAPDPASGFQTLGGLVSHAWISGRIETSEGALGAQEVAIVPIEIMTAGGGYPQ